MQSAKLILSKVPEYYLIFLAFASGYKPPLHLAPFAMGLIVIFSMQLIFKNKITGIVIASLFGVGNLYFLLAMLSEFSEFQKFSDGARQLLFVGLPLFVTNLIMAVVMVCKYAPSRETDVSHSNALIS
jgi:energy-coupling factor transporter transmembrane protein EcfT